MSRQWSDVMTDQPTNDDVFRESTNQNTFVISESIIIVTRIVSQNIGRLMTQYISAVLTQNTGLMITQSTVAYGEDIVHTPSVYESDD